MPVVGRVKFYNERGKVLEDKRFNSVFERTHIIKDILHERKSCTHYHIYHDPRWKVSSPNWEDEFEFVFMDED